jgi:hypothetical protein
MEPWFSGAVVDAVREAKSRRALFIVYVRDDSEQSQSMDTLWSDVWTKLENTSKMIALRLDKNTEACSQFIAIYKVQIYPTIYLINGQNGQVLKMIDQSIENSNQLQEIITNSLNTIEPKEQTTKTVDEKVAEARARLKELHDKRDEEAKEKEKEEELNRRRLGQQMLLDKQKKDEELIRKQAEDIRRDRLEQQKLQEKLKAQIQEDRDEKRRKYEQEQQSTTTQQVKPTPVIEKPKINYTRSRLQFRLTDGSFFTEDFPTDAHISDVYAYLQETLPSDQYRNGSYTLRTTHTRVTLTRDNPSTLKELELVPSAVLLVLNRGNMNPSPSTNVSQNQIFQSISMIFAWFMMQFNFLYQFIFAKLFGNRPPAPSRSTTNINNPREPKATTTKRENFKTDSTENPTIRRFHNTQDDSDDEEKRTWNGNSTQQM